MARTMWKEIMGLTGTPAKVCRRPNPHGGTADFLYITEYPGLTYEKALELDEALRRHGIEANLLSHNSNSGRTVITLD